MTLPWPGPVPVIETFGGSLVERGEGRAELSYTLPAGYTNSYGTLNGGVVAVLLDSAMAVAAEGLATATIRVNHLRPTPAGDMLRARGEVVRRGSRLVYAEATLVGSDGSVLARASQTGLRREPGAAPPGNSTMPAGHRDSPLPGPAGRRAGIPVVDTLGGEVLEQEVGSCLLRFPVRAAYTNPLGQLQGGMYAVFMDNAMGLASTGMSTIVLEANLFRSLRPGDAAMVRGRLIREGKRIVYAEAEVRDGDGALVARGSSTGLPRRRDREPEGRGTGSL